MFCPKCGFLASGSRLTAIAAEHQRSVFRSLGLIGKEAVLDFQLTEEQQQLKKSLREFAEREMLPNVMKWDEACHFPLEVVKELGQMGVMGAIFPAEYGGAGLGYVEYVIAIEELSRVDGS